MTIFELLDNTGKPYFRYGTVPAETVSNFFTFQNIDTRAVFPADNDISFLAPVYDVVYYTDEPNDIYSILDEFVKSAKNDGWIILEYPYDITCREPNLYGRLARITKINYNTIRT